MNRSALYPFAAILGQNQVKEALLITLVNPKAGGLLLVGESGSAKSTIVHAVTDLLTDRRIVSLPLNATEDMIFGSLDLQAAVLNGERRFSAGLLAKADKQVLFVDDIHLLRRELTGVLLDVASTGVSRLERDGISHCHDSRFTLVAAVNTEAGELPPAMLDRFGLCVSVDKITDAQERCEIIRRVIRCERAPAAFRREFQAQTIALAEKIAAATRIVDSIRVAPPLIQLAASLCSQANAAGHRGELFLLEAAKSLAALSERSYLLPADVTAAAVYVLPHRSRPLEEIAPPQRDQDERGESPADSDRENDASSEPQDSATPPSAESEDTDTGEGDHSQSVDSEAPNDTADDKGGPNEQTAGIDERVSLPAFPLEMQRERQSREGSGKRSLTRSNTTQGRYVRAERCRNTPTDIAIDATLRAAAPHQRFRRTEGSCAIVLERDDLRQKIREKRIGNTFLFVVDASGSMGARQRMSAVKGAIFALLQDAYQKRDRVGMIAFRRSSAEVLLPVTRSVDLAQKSLQTLPTGGKTPLAQGLEAAYRMLTGLGKKERDMRPILILITDGRANGSSAAIDDAKKAAAQIAHTNVQSIVIDTESDFLKLAVAKDIAREMGSDYYRLQEISGQNIVTLVRSRQQLA